MSKTVRDYFTFSVDGGPPFRKVINPEDVYKESRHDQRGLDVLSTDVGRDP